MQVSPRPTQRAQCCRLALPQRSLAVWNWSKNHAMLLLLGPSVEPVKLPPGIEEPEGDPRLLDKSASPEHPKQGHSLEPAFNVEPPHAEQSSADEGRHASSLGWELAQWPEQIHTDAGRVCTHTYKLCTTRLTATYCSFIFERCCAKPSGLIMEADLCCKALFLLGRLEAREVLQAPAQQPVAPFGFGMDLQPRPAAGASQSGYSSVRPAVMQKHHRPLPLQVCFQPWQRCRHSCG